MQHYNELDAVKVIRLARPKRDVSGTDRVRRQPQVGDLGTVVAVLSPTSRPPGYYVESLNDDGLTVWLPGGEGGENSSPPPGPPQNPLNRRPPRKMEKNFFF